MLQLICRYEGRERLALLQIIFWDMEICQPADISMMFHHLYLIKKKTKHIEAAIKHTHTHNQSEVNLENIITVL